MTWSTTVSSRGDLDVGKAQGDVPLLVWRRIAGQPDTFSTLDAGTSRGRQALAHACRVAVTPVAMRVPGAPRRHSSSTVSSISRPATPEVAGSSPVAPALDRFARAGSRPSRRSRRFPPTPGCAALAKSSVVGRGRGGSSDPVAWPTANVPPPPRPSANPPRPHRVRDARHAQEPVDAVVGPGGPAGPFHGIPVVDPHPLDPIAQLASAFRRGRRRRRDPNLGAHGCAALVAVGHGMRRGRRRIGQRRTLTRRSDDMTTGGAEHPGWTNGSTDAVDLPGSARGESPDGLLGGGRGSSSPGGRRAATGAVRRRRPHPMNGSPAPAAGRPSPAVPRLGRDRLASAAIAQHPPAWRVLSPACPTGHDGSCARRDSPLAAALSWGGLPPRGLPSPCSPHGLPGRPRGPWSASHVLRRDMFAPGRAALFDSSARPRLDLGRVWRLARLHPRAATLR